MGSVTTDLFNALHKAHDSSGVSVVISAFCAEAFEAKTGVYVSSESDQRASKMRVQRFAIREDILFLYCRVQKQI